ncbi:MAG: nicotinate-nucleotide diphosphorylase (carboxylating), partial [Planctomycetota bacterium]
PCDIILLDNMDCDQLRQAVAMRNQIAPGILLEASGGVTLETVADIAKTGVERISSGALTHSATNFDIGLDWRVRK